MGISNEAICGMIDRKGLNGKNVIQSSFTPRSDVYGKNSAK